MGGRGSVPPLQRDSPEPSGPLTSQGPGHRESLCRWTHCPDEPGMGPQQHPGGRGPGGSGPRGRGPGGWSPWTIQCLRSGFWVGLAKRAQQEEEVEVGVCFHPSFRVCCRLCLSKGRGPGSPRLPKGSALHPWALAASHFPGHPPRPPFHRLPSVLAEACLLVGSSWFSHLLVNSVSQMCSQPPRCIHGPSDTGDTAAGEAGHL